jgi:hypothetical protein
MAIAIPASPRALNFIWRLLNRVATTTKPLGAGCAPVTILLRLVIALHRAEKKRRGTRAHRETRRGIFSTFTAFSSAYDAFLGTPAVRPGLKRGGASSWPLLPPESRRESLTPSRPKREEHLAAWVATGAKWSPLAKLPVG